MSTGTGLGNQKYHLKPGVSEVQEKGYGRMFFLRAVVVVKGRVPGPAGLVMVV